MSKIAVFIDRYSVLASSARTEFISRLREFCVTRHTEFSDDELGEAADKALLRLQPTGTFETLRDPYTYAAKLLAAITVAEMRMQSASRYYPVSSRVGSTDAGARVGHQVNVIATLRDEFQSYLDQTGILLAGETPIIQGTLTRRNELNDTVVPFNQQPGPKPVSIQIVATGSGSVDLIWSESTQDQFYSYSIYQSSTPDIADPTRMQATDGTTTTPVNRGVKTTATLVEEIFTRPDTGRRVSGLSGTNFFVVVLTDLNGQIAVSNELEVTL